MNKKAKRIITAVLAMSMAFAAFPAAGQNLFGIAKQSLTVSAAQHYPCGMYAVNTPSGVNVRANHGTYAIINGAACNGEWFCVSRISNSWGYTNSIRCTNGTRSGWIYLPNCRFLYPC